jgi:hypothetical protein
MGVCLALLVAGVASGRGRSEDADADAQPVDRPDWVVAIIDDDIASLYPGADGGGYVGIGIGQSREEAVAAASVDFAGNVSTVVNATVTERETLTDGGNTNLDVVVESEVRSQAVISGLEELTWEDPRARVHYALIRTTVEEYNRRVADWIATMEAISEAERREAIRRLEDQQAAAERRMAEIQIQTLEDQVREADRRARAARHRVFLNMTLPAADRRAPTGYVPDGNEIVAAYRGGWEDSGVDLAWTRGLWEVATVGVTAETAWQAVDSADVAGSVVGAVRGIATIRLLDRAGWVTSSTLSVGAFGGAQSAEAAWRIGAFGVYDILVPELAATRYSFYAGSDAIRARAAWYPFWQTIEDAVAIDAVAHIALPDGRVLTATGGHSWFSIGLAFRPAEAVRFTVTTYNAESLRGAVIVSF